MNINTFVCFCVFVGDYGSFPVEGVWIVLGGVSLFLLFVSLILHLCISFCICATHGAFVLLIVHLCFSFCICVFIILDLCFDSIAVSLTLSFVSSYVPMLLIM